MTPIWVAIAESDLGVREELGPNDSAWIRRMWSRLAGSWLLGQPWCGGALAYWMQGAGIAYPRAYYRARAWLDWGIHLTTAVPGCVAVFDRAGGGHVGIVVGINMLGQLLVLGGNQGDAVSIAPFLQSRVLGFRWPAEHAELLKDAGHLPVLASRSPPSRNEA